MKVIRKRGDTSNILQIFIQDSSSTTGAGLAGLAFNSGSLTAYYHKDTDTTATAITLATMTVGTFTSSGFKEIDATNMPGWYQFCPPDASLSASGTPHSVGYHLKGATNMAPLAIECQLIAADVEDAVRLGLTALPNAAAEAAGGLYTRGTGAGQINQDANGRVDANTKAWLGGTIPAVNVTGVPLVDAKYLLGTIFATPATAGIPDVNAKNVNNVAATSVTTVNANIGTTQPVNFTGTGASALAKSDVVDIAGAAVSTTTAQLGVNTVKYNNQTAQTDSNNYPKVDIEAINAATLAAQALAQSTQSICYGTCSGGTTTTAVVSTLTNPSSLTDTGQLIGRTIIFLGNTTTTDQQSQASNITNSTTGATPTITFTAMTHAPANGDVFVVL